MLRYIGFVVIFLTVALSHAVSVLKDECPPNEEYLICGSACPANCTNYQKPVACTLQCVEGCFCSASYVRDDNGTCVKPDQCGVPLSPPICGENEEYLTCGTACPPTCNQPVPGICIQICVAECFCKEGFIRDSNGKCVEIANCPKLVENTTVVPAPQPECGNNEEYLTCGSSCPPTCDQPVPGPCNRACNSGCFCKEGTVRDSSGKCVEVVNCPKLSPPVCGDNEEYLACGPACPPTCEQPVPGFCIQICVAECFCKEGFIRDSNGKCVDVANCPKPPQPICGMNEEYLACGSACPRTCDQPEPGICILICVAECFCKEGFIRDSNGKCVEIANCPKLPAPQPECGNNEEYLTCGSSCPPTCDQPVPGPCNRACNSGCFCKEGTVRDSSGKCVEVANCPKPLPPVCGDNEEYLACGPACPPTCNQPVPGICIQICVAECFCKEGFIRDSNGKCVEIANCPKLLSPPPTCANNEEYLTCGSSCPPTCDQPTPGICDLACRIGCFCKAGTVRDSSGKCVDVKDCPPNKTTPAPQCGTNQEYQTCGPSCESSCEQPVPGPCDLACRVGCFCKVGTLRDGSGNCVDVEDCPATPCLNTDEVYHECLGTCEPSCSDPNPFCSKICMGGCVCAPGTFRSDAGDCVTFDKCLNITESDTVMKYIGAINAFLHL